jgi:hypothetical protein
MPAATLTLWCDECQHPIGAFDLLTDHLAAVLFAARKEHAKAKHDWHEREMILVGEGR